MSAESIEASFLGGLQAPSEARRFVAGHLGNRPAAPRHDIVLVVSELVTNSVQAGANQVDVQLTLTGSRVALTVVDDASGWPASRRPAPDDPRGRGLSIVQELADDWTITARDPGKEITVIWQI
ncbi:MAG TPA: ATP-binding protein [Marmoricola sp.]|jgi:two-component sensor histidine kinase|nr:ATP-binding protein [Marmoricola sp.]